MCGGVGSGLAFPYTTHWNGKEFKYIGCEGCGTAFVDTLPDDSDFSLMYTKENYHDVFYGNLELETYERSIAKMMMYCTPHRSVLDFGCGNGSFLVAARQAGFFCCGVEYTDTVREEARRNSGMSVYGFNELKDSGQKFDIIHLGDVLEHIPEPEALIKELSKLLSPGGIFFVEGPLENNSSLVYFFAASFKTIRQRLIIDTSCNIAPFHLFLTNKRAMKLFFTEVLGFHCSYFKVYETGWPYIASRGILLSVNIFIKHIIGLSAIALSKIDMRRDNILGNRFIGIFQP